MNLAEWKRNLKPGMKLICVYRWYWEKTPQKKPASGQQEITVVEVKATQMIYTVDGKPERNYMPFPKAADLNADENGFELYIPNDPKLHFENAGKVMSRYVYAAEEAACTA